jgi:predicted amidophosphoribosyltransferase
MLDLVHYANLFQYSPRGTSDISKKSRIVTDAIKAGRINRYAPRIAEILAEHQEDLSTFLNRDVTLIPMPRSSLTRESDLWPALEIAKMLASLGLGSVSTCLFRNKEIRKSSLYYRADDRPSIAEQYDSMSVRNVVPTSNITIVDDVLTLGRTSIAAASRLAEKFPNADIRVFALMKTRGIGVVEIDVIKNVEIGTITYNHNSGKCTRHPE